jgi:hypothetical protein
LKRQWTMFPLKKLPHPSSVRPLYFVNKDKNINTLLQSTCFVSYATVYTWHPLGFFIYIYIYIYKIHHWTRHTLITFLWYRMPNQCSLTHFLFSFLFFSLCIWNLGLEIKSSLNIPLVTSSRYIYNNNIIKLPSIGTLNIASFCAVSLLETSKISCQKLQARQ